MSLVANVFAGCFCAAERLRLPGDALAQVQRRLVIGWGRGLGVDLACLRDGERGRAEGLASHVLVPSGKDGGTVLVNAQNQIIQREKEQSLQ